MRWSAREAGSDRGGPARALMELHRKVQSMEHDPRSQRSLCLAYLSGYTTYDERGLPRKEYLAKGSEVEREARETLAFLLRSQEPLDRELRNVLAALFDPQLSHPVAVREVQFKMRNRGQTKNHDANTAIAWCVWEAARSGKTISAGVAEAVERFERDESTVLKLWSTYKPLFETVWGPLRQQE